MKNITNAARTQAVRTTSAQLRDAMSAAKQPAVIPNSTSVARPSGSPASLPRRTRRPVEQMIEAAPTAEAEVSYILTRMIALEMRMQKMIALASPESQQMLKQIRPDLARYIDQISQKLTG